MEFLSQADCQRIPVEYVRFLRELHADKRAAKDMTCDKLFESLEQNKRKHHPGHHPQHQPKGWIPAVFDKVFGSR